MTTAHPPLSRHLGILGNPSALRATTDKHQAQNSHHKPSFNVPDIIFDSKNNRTYKKGVLLGKGGFAKVYEVTNVSTGAKLAAKVIPRSLLTKTKYYDKLATEISIHKSLSHKNIVQFHSVFSDSIAYYIILEKCECQTLSEMTRRRKRLTEAEARYFVLQILDAVEHLHSFHIIHRDLKLGNLFLADGFVVKLGDFGLAARLKAVDERRLTMCGTPNYIAPEIVTYHVRHKKHRSTGMKDLQPVLPKVKDEGHSFEVDTWCIGIILYAMLYGRPPFESSDVTATYKRILIRDLHFPSRVPVSSEAIDLIQQILVIDPYNRLSLCKIRSHPWMQKSIPTSLPSTAFTIQPKLSPVKTEKIIQSGKENHMNYMQESLRGHSERKVIATKIDKIDVLRPLLKPVLSKVISNSREAPAPNPFLASWVDYTNKYGFGYQLSNGSVGLCFNDTTKIVSNANGTTFDYYDKKRNQIEPVQQRHDMEYYPPELRKKVALLDYFRNYLNDHSLHRIASEVRQQPTPEALVYIKKWMHTPDGLVVRMNNRTMQVNFIDHTKVILSASSNAEQTVSYIDKTRQMKTFFISETHSPGFNHPELVDRLKKVKTVLSELSKR